MKKSLITTTLLLGTLLFTGCSTKEIEPKTEIIETSKEEIIVSAKKNKQIDDDSELYYKDMIKRSMKKAGEETLKREKTHFALVSMRTNNLAGFPINTYKNLQRFCLSDLNSFECDSIKHKDSSNLKIILLSDLDYRIIAFNAKEVLEDIKKEEENK